MWSLPPALFKKLPPLSQTMTPWKRLVALWSHFLRDFSLACKAQKGIIAATLPQRVQTKILHTTRLVDLQKCHHTLTAALKKKKTPLLSQHKHRRFKEGGWWLTRSWTRLVKTADHKLSIYKNTVWLEKEYKRTLKIVFGILLASYRIASSENKRYSCKG